jgi:hypothetical protein
MKGQRRYAELPPMEPGEYGQDWRGKWHGVTPNGLACNLGNHTIVEHDDRTITVKPSIIVTDGRSSWHGHLTKGVWGEC